MYISNSCLVDTLEIKNLYIKFGTIVLIKRQFFQGVASFLCLKKVVSPKNVKQKKNLLRTLQKKTSTFEAITSLFIITVTHKMEISNKFSFFF